MSVPLRHPGVLSKPARRCATGLSLALALTLSACSNGGGSSGEDPAALAGHVHGVGTDPGDGRLYVATHGGLFKLNEDRNSLELVAGRVQDFMGFTVTGPDTFLASGHPGEGDDGPAALGLIESIDAGMTWQTLSLAGEADFHSLESAGSSIYGLDSGSGAVMRSEDGVAWEQSMPAPLADLAVDKKNTRVVGTSESGLLLSTDGGVSFEPVENSPILLLVDWAPDGTLVGIDPAGQVYSSKDLKSWDQLAALGGPPQAFSAEDDGVVYVALEDSVGISRDGGGTFEKVVDL